jgi:hypothetical protein
LRRWQQILATLPGRVQSGYSLIEVRANPAHQPAAAISSAKASRSGKVTRAGVPRAVASVTSAANAPRASPDLAAVSLTSSNSPKVGENCTTLGRATAYGERRCTLASVMGPTTPPSLMILTIGTAPGP